MKKFLFATLAVLLLTTLFVVGGIAAMAADVAPVEAGVTCPDGAHDFSAVEPVGDYYHQYVCSACGTAGAQGQIPHRYDRWGHNDTQHWMECVCGAKKSDLFADAIADHVIDTTKWYTNGQYHWNQCECGYIANISAHEGGEASCVAKAVCDICNVAYGEVDATAHAKDAYEWTLTETTHEGIYECCGLVVEETAHEWGEDHVCDVCAYVCTHTGGEANCTYLAVCDWCGKGYGELAPDNHHGGEANCGAAAVCEDCGSSYGEIDPDNHTSEEIYYAINADDAQKHDKKHSCCDSIIETTAHEGGTATCNALAICALCTGEITYGEFDAENHAEGHVITWVTTATTHSGTYSCCTAVIEETNHNWNGDNVCDDCAYVCETHTGGTATCSTQAACEYCGVFYGELDAANHESTEFTYAVNADDATKHDKKNACCEALVETVAHTGGTATCSTLAKCEFCEESYGELDPANHESTEFTYVVNADDATKHDKKNACCGALVETVAHTGGTATCKTLAVCEHCGESYGELDANNHESAEFTYVVNADDATKHDKKNACCGAVVETVAHTGGTATCKTLAVCEHCGESYGELDANNHESAEFLYDAVLNIDSASVQHAKKNACCGAVVATEDHTGGTATCMAKAVCEFCETEYGEKAMGNHVADPVYTSLGNGKHTVAYTNCCGLAMFYPDGGGEACSGGTATCCAEAVCEFCGAEYGGYDIDNHESTEVYYSFTDDAVHTEYHSCCERTTGNSASHVGGTATCQAAAVCTLCNTAYGTVDANNHANTTDFNYVVNADDATKHDKFYTCCPDVVAATEDHTGGVADCMNAKVCEHCGESYGELDASNHISTETYYAQTETQHQLKHTCCNTPVSEAADHDFNEEGVCLTCEYVCPHTAGTFIYAVNDDDSAKHDKFYACCRAYVDTIEHGFAADYSSDDAEHWYECTDCGAKSTSVEHTYALVDQSDGTHAKICDVCGHQHTEGVAAHDFVVFDKNDAAHWMKCACGALPTETTEVAHTYDQAKSDDDNHWNECVCGQIDATSVAAHTYEGCKDESTHWEACACGREVNRAEHSFILENEGKDAYNHWNKCACGQDSPDVTAHDWTDGACACGYVCLHGDAADHTFAPNADNADAHDEICHLCELLLDTAEHDYTGWVIDTEMHWVACSYCAQKQNEEGGVAHTAGTAADCLNPALCAVCEKYYGSADANNHVSEETEVVVIPGNNQQHKVVHACCDAEVEKVNHTYENSVCTVCAYTCTHSYTAGTCSACGAVCTHTGGEATCKDKATCTVCGEKYGDLKTEHTFGEWAETLAPTTEAPGQKKRTCSVCGAAETAEIEQLKKPWYATKLAIALYVVGGVAVVVVAIVIAISAKKAAEARAAAALIKPWRTTKKRKPKWKKKK